MSQLYVYICCCCLATKSCPTLCDPMDLSPPGSSVHGILQARILHWVAMPSSRGSSRPRDYTQVSSITGRFFNIWATREALFLINLIPNAMPKFFSLGASLPFPTYLTIVHKALFFLEISLSLDFLGYSHLADTFSVLHCLHMLPSFCRLWLLKILSDRLHHRYFFLLSHLILCDHMHSYA